MFIYGLFLGGGANEVIALSLRGSFIAEAISLTVEGIASSGFAMTGISLITYPPPILLCLKAENRVNDLFLVA